MKSRVDTPAPATIRFALLGFALLLLLPGALSGQSRKELEERRKRLLQEIKETTSLLDETKKNRAATLDSYFTLQQQIQKRQQLITTLREEIAYADAGIARNNEVIAALRRDIEQLKAEYAAMLRTAYRHKLNNSYLLFLFSADSFNEAFRRWRYLLQYDRYRSRQARLIEETQASLAERAEQLARRRVQKADLLAASEKQQYLLAAELESKNKLLSTLKSDEKRLIAELKDQQAAHEKLNAAIESVIREAMAEKRRAARRPEALAAAGRIEGSAPAIRSDFHTFQGRLPWPVSQGEVSRPFGAQPHPNLKTIMVMNNGIDIRTRPSAEVYAIFEGQVVGTRFIQGYQNMVIIRHGDYYTVYSNLAEVYVSRDDVVKAQQIIGKVGSVRTELHFEIWREKQRLNPVKWVKKQ